MKTLTLGLFFLLVLTGSRVLSDELSFTAADDAPRKTTAPPQELAPPPPQEVLILAPQARAPASVSRQDAALLDAPVPKPEIHSEIKSGKRPAILKRIAHQNVKHKKHHAVRKVATFKAKAKY